MAEGITVGIVGGHQPNAPAYTATEEASEHPGASLGVPVVAKWLHRYPRRRTVGTFYGRPWRRCHSSRDSSGYSGKCISSSPVGTSHQGAA